MILPLWFKMTKLAHNPALLFLDTKKNDLPNVQIQLFEFDNEHALVSANLKKVPYLEKVSI